MRAFWEVLDFAWGEPADRDGDLGDDGADDEDDWDGMDGGDGDSSSPGSPPDGNRLAVGDGYPVVDSQVADEVVDSQEVSCGKTTMDSDEGTAPDSSAAASTSAPNDVATHEVSSKPCAAEASPANTANCTGKLDKSPKFGIESKPLHVKIDRVNAIRHRVSHSIQRKVS